MIYQRGNDDTYRVIQSQGSFCFDGSSGLNKRHERECRRRFDFSVQRTASIIKALTELNHWDYWITLTFDKSLVGGSAMRSEWRTVKSVLTWLQMYNANHGISIRYMLVPDLHSDGAFHLHGLLSSVPARLIEWWTMETAPTAKIRARIRSGVPCGSFKPYSARFGFSRLEPLKNAGAAGHYLSSHYLGGLDKLEALSARLGPEHNFVFHSKGLNRWVTSRVSDVPTSDGFLDVRLWVDNLRDSVSFAGFLSRNIGSFIPVEAFGVSGGFGGDADIYVWRRFAPLPDELALYRDVATCPLKCDIIRAFGIFVSFMRDDWDALSVFFSSPSSGFCNSSFAFADVHGEQISFPFYMSGDSVF